MFSLSFLDGTDTFEDSREEDAQQEGVTAPGEVGVLLVVCTVEEESGGCARGKAGDDLFAAVVGELEKVGEGLEIEGGSEDELDVLFGAFEGGVRACSDGSEVICRCG